MKPSSLAVFVVLCVAFGALNVTGQYSVTMPYKNVTVENVNGIASFSGAFPYGEAGQPELPAYKVSFLLPPGADFKDITVSLDNVSEDTLSETYAVNPMMAPSPEYIAKKGLKLKDGKDMKIYEKNAFYPADYKGKVFFGRKGQYEIVDVAIYPFLYNPQTNKLRTITGGTLSVSAPKGSKQGPKNPRNARYEWSLKRLIADTSVFDDYGAKPMQSDQSQSIASQAAVATQSISGQVYVIVTTNEIRPHLNSYISSLNNRGASVLTATENQLGSATGQTKADAIRSYLQYVYILGGCHAVVLIGNPDPDDGDVPMAKNSLTYGYATDYYYADIVCDTFPDAYAELYVGRIPVLPSQPFRLDSLDTILAKGVNYVSQTSANTKWRRFAMLPCVPYGFTNQSLDDDNFRTIGEAVKDTLWKAGWEYYRLYEPYNWSFSYYQGQLQYGVVNMRVHPEEYFCNYSNVITAWNRLKPGLVVWGTHGGIKVADRILDGQTIADGNPQQVYLLNRGYPAMVFAASCATAEPTHFSSDVVGNLAYQAILDNAICYIGATEDASNPEHLACLYASAQKDIMNFSCGEALNIAKEGILNKSNMILFNLYGFPDACLNLDTLGTLHPPKLDSVRVGQTSPKSKIKILWDTVYSATSYVIERGDSNATRISGFSYRATVSGGAKTNYVDSNPPLPASTKFKYRIYAQNASGRSGYSRIDSARTYNSGNQSHYAPAPAGITAQGDRSNGASVSWPTAGAGISYVVKRSRKSIGPFDPIAITSNLSFKDTNLVNDTTYYYVVSSVNSSGQSNHSPVSSATIPKIHITPPTITSIQSNTSLGAPANALTIKWVPANVNGFYPLGYRIMFIDIWPENTLDTINNYYSNSGHISRAEQWDAVPTYGLGTFCDPRICGNSKYNFRIESFSQKTSGYIYSSATSPYPVTPLNGDYPPPSKVTVIMALEIMNEYAGIVWNWPNYSDGFQIFYKDITGGQTGRKWQSTDAEGDRYNEDIQIGANKKCKFYVRTFKKYNGVRVYSDYSDSVVVTTDALLCKPTISVNYCTDRKVAISIDDNSISDTGYSIERKTGSGGSFSIIGTVKEPNVSQYQDSVSLTRGQTYYYRARAYAGTVYSDYSNEVNATTCTNIALGKTATASSTTSPYTASKAVDNDSTSDLSRWAAATTIPPTAAWKVDLGVVDTISSFQIVWRIAGTWRYIISGSLDSLSWDVLRDSSVSTPTTQTHYIDLYNLGWWKPAYRYIKTVVTKAPTGVKPGFYEFRVFGGQ